MADSVNWSKLREQAIDLKALDLRSNWVALRQVLVVLTGALIFVGCALAAVLKTHTVNTVPRLLLDPKPATAQKDYSAPGVLLIPAPPYPVHIVRKPTETVPLTASEPRMAEARRVEEILAQAARRVGSGDVIGARDVLAAAEDGAQGPVTFALAETYDPNMLGAWGSRGVTADVSRARMLYRKALELGVTKAQMRLDALK